MSVCRENGALQHRWSRHRRRTIRVCIEPVLAGSRRTATGGLGTRLSHPGAWTDSSHLRVPLRGDSRTGRCVPAGSVVPVRRPGSCWAPHTGRRCFGLSSCARVTRGLPGCDGPARRLASRGRFAGSFPPRARLPRRVPDCRRFGGRLCVRGAVLGTPGGCCSTPVVTSAEARSLRAEFPKDLRCSDVSVRFDSRGAGSASWVVSAHRGHRSVVRWVLHGIGHNAQDSPSVPEGPAPPPLPCSRSAQRPAGHRFPQCQDAVLTSTTSTPGPKVARAG